MFSTYCLRPSGTMLCGPIYMSNSARQRFSLGKPALTLASAKSVNPGGNRPPVSVPSSAQSTAICVCLEAVCMYGACLVLSEASMDLTRSAWEIQQDHLWISADPARPLLQSHRCHSSERCPCPAGRYVRKAAHLPSQRASSEAPFWKLRPLKESRKGCSRSASPVLSRRGRRSLLYVLELDALCSECEQRR